METNQVKILGRGLDTVVLNIYPTDKEGDVIAQRLPDVLEEELNLYKERAQQLDEAVPTRWAFDGGNLFMKDKGGSPFKWILTCRQFTLGVSRGVKVSMIGQVRFSSEYLWQWNHHPEKGISDVLLFLTNIFGDDIAFQPAAVDIALDFTGWDVGSTCFKRDFIYRSVKTSEFPSRAEEGQAETYINGPEQPYDRWKRITGLPFGVRTSAVSCLIYDKTDEIKYESRDKIWFHDLWQAQRDEQDRPVWDGEAPVWRVEFRFKRQALHEFDLENIYQVLEHLPDLWAYAAGHAGGVDGLPDGWLRYVIPSIDSNRARWPVHPFWQVVQGAFVLPVCVQEREQEIGGSQAAESRGGESLPAADAPSSTLRVMPLKPFQRRRHLEINRERACAAVAGYTSTYEAWRPRERGEVGIDISVAFHMLYEDVVTYLEEKGRDFEKDVKKKRVRYGLETAA